MLKILQARLQQYVNCELPDVQGGFRKGRETRDQIANICWIIEKAREFQKKKQRKKIEWERLEISSRKLDTKGTFHAKMDTIKDRNGMELTEAEDIFLKGGKNTPKNYTKKRC